MKILVITKDSPDANWENASEVSADEARHVYQLQKDGVIREIYFTEKKDAILILECTSPEQAQAILEDFPLIKAGLLTYELNELKAYTGFDRIMK